VLVWCVLALWFWMVQQPPLNNLDLDGEHAYEHG
jgi:hypothetical protein